MKACLLIFLKQGPVAKGKHAWYPAEVSPCLADDP